MALGSHMVALGEGVVATTRTSYGKSRGEQKEPEICEALDTPVCLESSRPASLGLKCYLLLSFSSIHISVYILTSFIGPQIHFLSRRLFFLGWGGGGSRVQENWKSLNQYFHKLLITIV